MSSGNKDLVLDTLGPTSVTLLLGSAKSFQVPMEGHNALQLNCNYTRSGGTALTFTFTTQEEQDANATYALKKLDVAGGTITAGSFTYTTSSTEKFTVVFPITGRNVAVTVTGTGTTNSDTMVVYPHCLVIG